ncbi:MAG TPA: zinc ribbon domain-containing protein [Thermoplasmata archaeon]|nr:zinc ribbon domain-containing protein [Thermoplasmata archaeon]
MLVHRRLVTSLASPLPVEVAGLLLDFRLLTNLCIRQALSSGLTARHSLFRFALDSSREANVNCLYGLAAADLARSLLKGHRRRVRSGLPSRVPYVRKPHLRVPSGCFHLDPVSGRLRLSLRSGEWTSLALSLSSYHRRRLAETGVVVRQIWVFPDRLTLVLGVPIPEEYAATALIALDTNESSMDGAFVPCRTSEPLNPTPITTLTTTTSPPVPSPPRIVSVKFPDIRTVQGRHFARRRRLARKKAHDARVKRRLLRREGWRERHRVGSRLHVISADLVARAFRLHAALAFEDLTGMPAKRRARPSTRRRLSSWPRGELHRQIAYKAQQRGVPIYWVNPRYSSKTCPKCGDIQKHRSRVGARFDCPNCGWSMDRQFNAGINLATTVLREHPEELGGVRLHPDALLNDAMRPLYWARRARPARAERRGREGRNSEPALARARFE